MQERRSEDEQEGQGRDEDGDRPAHDRAGEARPRSVGVTVDRHLADGSAIEVAPEQREQGRQQGQGGGDREEHDDRPGDPDRTQDHELEEDEAQEAEQDRQAAEEHGPTGGGHGQADGRPEPLRVVGIAAGQLLPELAGHEQRVVDAEAEAEEGRQVEHEDAHRRQRRDDEDGGQGHEDGRATDHERHAGRHEGPEDEEQGEGRQRQGDELAALEVALADRLDIAVERRPAGQLHRQARRLAEAFAQDRQGVRGIVGRQVQEDDVEGGMAVRRDLARLEQVGHDPGHVRGVGDVTHRLGRRQFEFRRAGLERRAREDDDEGRRRQPELLLEDRLRARRLEVVADEAAGRQRPRHLGREWQGDDDEQAPHRHDEPGAGHDEAAESIEGLTLRS